MNARIFIGYYEKKLQINFYNLQFLVFNFFDEMNKFIFNFFSAQSGYTHKIVCASSAPDESSCMSFFLISKVLKMGLFAVSVTPEYVSCTRSAVCHC